MTTYLLDGNVLVALTLETHVHRTRCLCWFASVESFATCPITEGTLLRLQMMLGRDNSAAAAWKTLHALHRHPKHRFWQDNFSYTDLPPIRLTGHRQVTDSWLAELARRNNGKLATLDEGLAVLWPESTILVPV